MKGWKGGSNGKEVRQERLSEADGVVEMAKQREKTLPFGVAVKPEGKWR